VLIAGCGYVGLTLGAQLTARGHRVSGLRRPGSDSGPLLAAGLTALGADLTRPADVEALEGAWDRVVYCAAPLEPGPAAYRAVYLDAARLLATRLRRERGVRVVVTGSTGVYGQTDGEPVTEESPADPRTDTGRVLREAEELWRSETDAVVLRVAGIYGPGRHRLGALSRGEVRLRGDGGRWMNLIHRDDLVEALVALVPRDAAGGVYNVADDASPTEREYYEWICGRLGVAPPGAGPGADPEPAGPRSRRATNKRVVARKLREETGWRPRYPTFREGYGPLIEEWLAGRAG
jgi:nucleoside-diphosphate-sugar epimerase